MLNYYTSVNVVTTLLCGLQEEELTVHNTVVMKGFVEILVILWYNISAKLQEVRGPNNQCNLTSQPRYRR